MSYAYDLRFEPDYGYCEDYMIKDYMDVVKDQALDKLTPIELAALFNDFAEFCVRYREEKEMEFAQNQME